MQGVPSFATMVMRLHFRTNKSAPEAGHHEVPVLRTGRCGAFPSDRCGENPTGARGARVPLQSVENGSILCTEGQ